MFKKRAIETKEKTYSAKDAQDVIQRLESFHQSMKRFKFEFLRQKYVDGLTNEQLAKQLTALVQLSFLFVHGFDETFDCLNQTAAHHKKNTALLKNRTILVISSIVELVYENRQLLSEKSLREYFTAIEELQKKIGYEIRPIPSVVQSKCLSVQSESISLPVHVQRLVAIEQTLRHATTKANSTMEAVAYVQGEFKENTEPNYDTKVVNVVHNLNTCTKEFDMLMDILLNAQQEFDRLANTKIAKEDHIDIDFMLSLLLDMKLDCVDMRQKLRTTLDSFAIDVNSHVGEHLKNPKIESGPYRNNM